MRQLPEMPDLTGLLAEIRAATEQARAQARAVTAEREALARDTEELEDRRAAAARRGELGPDWQVLQRRIDAGRTTPGAILSGQDSSPEARRVAEGMLDRVSDIVDQAHSHKDEGADDRYAELNETIGRMRELLRPVLPPDPDQQDRGDS